MKTKRVKTVDPVGFTIKWVAVGAFSVAILILPALLRLHQ